MQLSWLKDPNYSMVAHRLKIVIINGKNPYLHSGGYQTYTRNLGKMLTDLGYEVHIFCFGKTSSIKKTTVGTLHLVSSKLFYWRLFRSREIGSFPFLSPSLAKAIANKFQADSKILLYGVGPWSFTGIITKLFYLRRAHLFSFFPTTLKHEARAAISGTRTKYYGILSKFSAILTYLTIIQVYSLIEYLTLLFSDRIIVHYNSTKRIIQSQFGIKNKKFIKIPDYFNFRNPKPKKVHPKVPLILLVTRHDPRKGIIFLLEAFSILNHKEFEYKAIIIGSGQLLKIHQHIVRSLNLKNVYLKSYVKNINTYLQKASLYALPSLEEGSSSISLLEAMQAGLPIISTDVDGIPEDIENGKSGFLVRPQDPKALAGAIQRLLDDQTFAQKLGNKAKRSYLLKHDKTKAEKSLLQALNKFKV